MLLTLQEAQCDFVANTLKSLYRIFRSAFHTNGQCESRETSLHTNNLISPASLNHARERESPTFLGHAQRVMFLQYQLELEDAHSSRSCVRNDACNMWPAASRNTATAPNLAGWVQPCSRGLWEETKLPVNLYKNPHDDIQPMVMTVTARFPLSSAYRLRTHWRRIGPTYLSGDVRLISFM